MGLAYAAHAKLAERVVPGEGALDDPAFLAQPAAVGRSSARELGTDAAPGYSRPAPDALETAGVPSTRSPENSLAGGRGA